METGGIGGSGVLVGYLVLAVALSGFAALLIRRLRRSGGPGGARDAGELTAVETAYLRDGPTGALSAAIAALRAHRMVNVLRHRKIASSVATVPVELSALDQAILDAARHPVTLGILRSDSGVQHQLRSIDDRLTRAGLVPTTSQRRLLRAMVLAVGLVAVAGLLAPLAGAWFTLALVAATLVVTVWLWSTSRGLLRRTPAGEARWNTLRQQYAHLKPTEPGVLATDDPDIAAMTVAIFDVDVVPPVRSGTGMRSTMDMSAGGGAAGG